MKKISHISYFIFHIFLLLSCTQETTISEKNYFDLAGLINQKVIELNKNKPTISKTLIINEQKENLKTKDIDWQKELELFTQADINKQAFQLSYAEQKTDSTLVYELKKGEKLTVKSLKISFDENKTPKKVEAILSTKNYLFESEKKLLMILENEKLKSYEIDTWQELFIGKRKFFKVLGEI